MGEIRAIWDSEAEAWVCPQCKHPLDDDGWWEDHNGAYVLWACHNCALEFSRGWGETGTPIAQSPDTT